MSAPEVTVMYPEVMNGIIMTMAKVPWHYLVIFLVIPGYLVSFLMVHGSIRVARQFDVLARPSDRGSHEIPTPRLGGIGAAMAFYFGVLFMHRLKPDLILSPWLLTCLLGGAWALIGGFLDDVLELPPRWKFLFQFAAAGSAVALGFYPASFDIPGLGQSLLPQGVGYIFAFLFIVFWMNAYNFMDGMDGQATIFGIMVGIGFFVPFGIFLNLGRHLVEFGILGAIIGALLGLLWHNHPWRGSAMKTFMGDSGSQFFGFLLAVEALHLAQKGSLAGKAYPFGAALIALSPFAWDVLYTLMRRTLRGENILQAHRSHLYQRLLIAGWSHGSTLLLNIAFWFGAVVLSWCYTITTNVGDQRGQFLVVGATMAWLLMYTSFVLVAEGWGHKKGKVEVAV